MKRYIRRSACAGFMRVCNATKDGRVLSFWYYLKIGTGYFPFDIRELAKRAKVDMPPLVPDEEITEAIGARDRVKYESLLQKDLHTICAWCVRISAQDFMEPRK